MNTVVFNDFIDALTSRVQSSLPGVEAQLKMAPEHRKTAEELLAETSDYKIAAVLALLFPDQRDGRPRIVLMERAGGAGIHANQISFPGGKMEPGETLKDTALRESFEELGILPDQVQLIGPLTTLYIPPSKFYVHPFMGYLHHPPEFNINASEVKKVITPALETFLDPDNRKSGLFRSGSGKVVDAPYYQMEELIIWGATAMMMSEIVELVTALR